MTAVDLIPERGDSRHFAVVTHMEKEYASAEYYNTNAKEIMDNSELCAQFLRKYSEVELLKGVRPEDIEDWTEKLRPFVGVEFEGDSVKKVRVQGDVENLFVVCLLEHKSEVDYDVAFQLLKYMVGIWNLHRNEANQKKKNASRRKGFRYPLIIPIVYYEGKEKWTAAYHWKERVEFSEVFGQYVPDFTYKLIDLNTYSTKELLCTDEETKEIQLICKKLAKGCAPTEIADALESELDLIADKICFAENFAPDYDFNKVYEAWQREV